MDKGWMQNQRWSREYIDGVDNFLRFAFENSSKECKILCPCVRCVNINWKFREDVREHLICDGFVKGYHNWYHHGEFLPSPNSSFRVAPCVNSQNHESNMQDDIGGLLQDAFNMHQEFGHELTGDGESNEHIVHDRNESGIGVGPEQPSGEAAKFYKLLEDMNEPLYEGSKYSKLSFVINFFHLKCMCGMTGKAFDSLCDFLKSVFPFAAIPDSCYDVKKIIKDLGFGYEKIHSCPNDCMLYWGDRTGQQSCHVCHSSRWTATKFDGTNKDDDCGEQYRKKPEKVLRYFPLIPRLQRLFMSSKNSDSMRWHQEGRTKDGQLRHPADALAWKKFDSMYPDFASDSRNVRLGLASDGFNPFKMMSTSYSTWPVVLIPYNLPPWIGMKQPSFFLSMIIPGDKGPGNDIDIYLQPLIEELKQLWEGVDTYDASSKQHFRLRASLLWTINDFPVYANLSGWSTKGKYACPCCAGGTASKWLKNGKKFCYMEHRRWLPLNHYFRRQARFFDGSHESREAPSPLPGTVISSMLDNVNFTYGKKSSDAQSRKRVRLVEDSLIDDGHVRLEENDEEDDLGDALKWKKRSIFFDLPYWKNNLLRHNLDVMHIEKNVCENIISTILNVDKKSKDNVKSRLDLVEMGIRSALHPHEINGRIQMPLACFAMTKREKDVFCRVLKDVKVPDAYAANISRSVNLKEQKLLFLKAHDYHILMHDLLPIALRSSMSKEVTSAIIELCKYTHTSGSKSFARKRHEMEVETGRKPGRIELFLATHSKKDGSHMNEESKRIMEEVQERFRAIDEGSSGSNTHDLQDQIFIDVIGKERHGRVRGLGMGPTPTTYFGIESSQRTSIRDVHNLKEEVATMTERVQQLEAERARTEEERVQREARIEQKLTQVEVERTQIEAELAQERQKVNRIMDYLRDKFPDGNF